MAVAIASVAYTGFVPVAPGTAGSIVGLALYAALAWVGAPQVATVVVAAGLFLVGVWAAGEAERHFGLADPGPVVIDEVVGMLVALVFTGAGTAGALAGFVLFRAFDIIKPYPAARLERLEGGWGVMADDVVAAVYANLVLQAWARLAVVFLP